MEMVRMCQCALIYPDRSLATLSPTWKWHYYCHTSLANMSCWPGLRETFHGFLPGSHACIFIIYIYIIIFIHDIIAYHTPYAIFVEAIYSSIKLSCQACSAKANPKLTQLEVLRLQLIDDICCLTLDPRLLLFCWIASVHCKTGTRYARGILFRGPPIQFTSYYKHTSTAHI